jgi:hypothetical protein
MRSLLLLGPLLVSACARGPGAPSISPQQEISIVFPRFLDEESILLGQPGKNYNLDGASLQALMVVVSDFFPPDSPREPCLSKPSAHRFLLTRRGDIIFVEIYADISSCDWKLLGMDYGARYAISMDGRILRRLAIGEPDGVLAPSPAESRDGGLVEGTDYSDKLGFTSFGPSTDVRLPSRRDAGSQPRLPSSTPVLDGGSLPDAGIPPDAGSFPDAGTSPGT